MAGFAVDGLDHVHVRVRDRAAAAAWYGRVLGLVAPAAMRHWSQAPGGPLFLATPAGAPCLSLFAGEPETDGDHTIAFRTDAAGFAAFLDRLETLEVAAASGGARGGARLGRDDIVDHGGAWSLYFRDPDGNRLELTSYEDPAGAAAARAR